AVRDAGLKIAYAPAALVPTFEGATRAICLEWCVRQMMMATLYLPIVRRYAAASFAIFDGSVILGLASLSLASALGPSYLVPPIQKTRRGDFARNRGPPVPSPLWLRLRTVRGLLRAFPQLLLEFREFRQNPVASFALL